MEYYMNGKIINLPTEEEPFGIGSEGKVYKKGKYAYKIYYPEMLNENHGNKEFFHNYLLTIPTKQIILPDQKIYTLDGEYIGYRTILIPGNKRKKTGITKLPIKTFIKNLEILEEDFDTLSHHYVLAADVSPVNYIFNKNKSEMTIIDPGRYRHHCLTDSYKKLNDLQLESLIELLLYMDSIEYKTLNSKKKLIELRHFLKEEKRKKNCKYSEFFKEKEEQYETAEEYMKSLKKYIK